MSREQDASMDESEIAIEAKLLSVEELKEAGLNMEELPQAVWTSPESAPEDFAAEQTSAESTLPVAPRRPVSSGKVMRGIGIGRPAAAKFSLPETTDAPDEQKDAGEKPES